MEGVDWSQFGMIGFVGLVLGSIATFFATKGVDAYLKVRKDAREDEDARDSKTIKGYEYLVTNLGARIVTLEGLLTSTQRDHLDCEKRFGVMQGRMDQMERELKALKNGGQSGVDPA